MSTLNARLTNPVGTAAEWTAENPTLLAGEIGVESDTGKFKVGDGTTVWTGLDYAQAEGGLASTIAVQDDGTEVVAAASRLNFTGSGVTASDGGDGTATIDVPGGGGIASLTVASIEATEGVEPDPPPDDGKVHLWVNLGSSA